jgi:type IV pilus assembly protein PilM
MAKDIPDDESPAPKKPAKTKAAKPDKAGAETAVQTEPPAKGKKKKAKVETGITAKPGLSSYFNFSKAAPTGVWGVDLGQCALKAIRLEIIDGMVTATAFDYVEHPKILSQPDADPDELTREALAKFLSRNTLRGDTVAISVPGQSGLARFVKLPPVEEKKIPDIVRFEAKQQIPFNLDEVVWDYQKLGVNELAPGFVETEIGLFAMKRDMVNRYLQHFKEVGVEVHLVQMAPLSLCNFVAYDLLGQEVGGEKDETKGARRCITALDIGADSSNLVITDGGRIIWQRPIPLGGNHFTRALTKDLKLTFAKAEHLKRNAVKSPDLKKILASLKPVLSDFVGEVQRSLGYFTNTHRDAQIEYMVGLGNAFRLPGLQRFLGEKLQMDVRKLAKMERLTGDTVVSSATYTENILSFAVAYGLALQGLKKTRLQTNLLPGEIRAERAVRGKKPWAVAAAALLMFGLGVLAVSYYLGYQAFGAPVVTAAEAKANEVAKTAEGNEAKYTQAKDAAHKEEEAVKSIVAGQFERKDWLELTRFLFGKAVPQPDGTNLFEPFRKKYWETRRDKGSMSGKEAWDDFLKHPETKAAASKEATTPMPMVGSAKAPPPVEELPAGIDDLVQFNIEFFDQRFSDDLSSTWAQIKDKQLAASKDDASFLANVRSAAPFKEPEGKGWVIEVQGTTYHKDPQDFIRDTLMNNIYLLSLKAGEPPTATPAPTAAPTGAPGAVKPADADVTPTSLAADEDAYKGKISHVVLFNAASNSPTSVVGQSVLDSIMNSSGSGAGGSTGLTGGAPPMGSMPPGMSPGGSMPPGGGLSGASGAAGPSGRENWRPLSPFMGGGGGNGMGSSTSPFNNEMMRPQSYSGSQPARTTGSSSNPHQRTEFVVLFIWKELTPSDALRGDDGTAPKPLIPAGGPGPAGSMPPGMTAPAPPAAAAPLTPKSAIE